MLKLTALVAVACLGLTAPRMGPPGICSTIACGEASKVLDQQWEGVAADLPGKLPVVLDALASNTAGRMEALRRVAMNSVSRAPSVVSLLAVRALEKEGQPGHAAAVFDVGYVVHLYATLGDEGAQRLGVQDGVAGYAMVTRAITEKGDAGMHVGAAYMTLPAMQPNDDGRQAKARARFDEHARQATKLMAAGSPDEANLEFVLQFEGTTVQEVRARLADSK